MERHDCWREAVLTAGLAVFDWDVPARRIWRSPEMLSTWDYPDGPNEAVDGARAVIHPDDFPSFQARMTEIEGGTLERATLEIRMRSREGAWRWVRWRARVVSLGEDRRPLRVVGTVNDIDELWKDRDLARESQMRLQGIVDSAMDAIISIDDSQRITLFNRAAERIFGYEPLEVLGPARSTMLIPDRFHREHHRHVESFGRTGVSSRPMMAQRIVTALRKGGEEFPIDASISQNEIRGHRFYTVILRDVSVRERTRRELAQAREDLRELSVASRTAREQENSRISRELHDELGQNLTSLKMDLAWLEANAPPGSAKFLADDRGDALRPRQHRGRHAAHLRRPAPADARRPGAPRRPRMAGRGNLAAARLHRGPRGRRAERAASPSPSPRRSTASSRRASPTPAGTPRRSRVRVALRTIGPEVHLRCRRRRPRARPGRPAQEGLLRAGGHPRARLHPRRVGRDPRGHGARHGDPRRACPFPSTTGTGHDPRW